MREGESAQHDRVNDCELGCCTANAETKHEHCQKTKRFVFKQDSQSDSNILTKRIQNHGKILQLVVNDPSIAQLNDAFPIRSVFVRVCDLHNGHAFAIELAKQLHDFLALTGVQVSRGFVSEQKLGLSNNRPRNTDELLLPAGKLTRIQIFFSDDLETVERVGHQSGALAFTIPAI